MNERIKKQLDKALSKQESQRKGQMVVRLEEQIEEAREDKERLSLSDKIREIANSRWHDLSHKAIAELKQELFDLASMVEKQEASHKDLVRLLRSYVRHLDSELELAENKIEG